MNGVRFILLRLRIHPSDPSSSQHVQPPRIGIRRTGEPTSSWHVQAWVFADRANECFSPSASCLTISGFATGEESLSAGPLQRRPPRPSPERSRPSQTSVLSCSLPGTIGGKSACDRQLARPSASLSAGQPVVARVRVCTNEGDTGSFHHVCSPQFADTSPAIREAGQTIPDHRTCRRRCPVLMRWSGRQPATTRYGRSDPPAMVPMPARKKTPSRRNRKHPNEQMVFLPAKSRKNAISGSVHTDP